MPVVVNQLKIKSNVKDSGDSKSSSKSAKEGGGGKMGHEEREILIKECIRRVMEELRFEIGR